MQKLFAEETTIINSYGYPVLDAGGLASYPALHEAIEDMLRTIALKQNTRSPSKRLGHVSIEAWNSFQKQILGDA